MSGFANAKVDADFFPDGCLKCTGEGIPPRNSRFNFEERFRIHQTSQAQTKSSAFTLKVICFAREIGDRRGHQT